MKFCEDGFTILPNFPSSFVYFLIDGDEVVYVGQTRNGISRPLSHKDKEYDSIVIKEASPENLYDCEEYYIAKYSPKYNMKMVKYVSLLRARNIIRDYTGNVSYSVRTLKKDAVLNGIQLHFLQNGLTYISPKDLKFLCSVLQSKYME